MATIRYIMAGPSPARTMSQPDSAVSAAAIREVVAAISTGPEKARAPIPVSSLRVRRVANRPAGFSSCGFSSAAGVASTRARLSASCSLLSSSRCAGASAGTGTRVALSEALQV